jgi:LacI family transcriptional regulator
VAILIDSTFAVERDLLRGITKYSRLHGHWVFYNVANWDISVSDLKGCDGVILRHRQLLNKPEEVKKIVELGVPVILPYTFKDFRSDVICIQKDNEGAGKMAADYFINKGFSAFTYCGLEGYSWSEKRCKGFLEAIEEYKDHDYFFDSLFLPQSPRECEDRVSAWIKSMPKPFCLFCCNDEMGKEVLEICKNFDFEVPSVVAVLGVDNDDLLCEICDPPLSSISFNPVLSGFEAASMLDKAMKGEEVTKMIRMMPLHVKTRQSTDVFACKDKDVVNALHFIRDNYRELLQVEDVVQKTSLGRRALEKHFQNVLGHSIYDEIKRNRVEEIAKLLIETDWTITRIARHVGFSYTNNFARIFQKIKGTTPRKYRKKYRSEDH